MDHILSSFIDYECVLQRPAYSRYQIANLIKMKRKELGISLDDLAKIWDMPVEMVRLIEEGKRSLNTSIYKKVADFLKIDFSELTKVYVDKNCYSFRKEFQFLNEETKDTVKLANIVFHEILGQESLTGRV